MDYSHLFVCLMGMGTVFIGLICLIALVTLMGAVLRKREAPPAAPQQEAAGADRQELAAAIAAAAAEELGTDVTGIRVLSIKKV